MNKVILMGRLTKDPTVRRTTEGTAIAGFDIAVDRRFKSNDGVTADFFSCSCFGKKAEFVEKYLKKGTKIALTGEIQNNNYTNKDGQKVYGTRILVDEVEFAESKKQESNYNADDSGFESIPEGIEDDLPFK